MPSDPPIRFADLGLPTPLVRAVDDAGYEEPSPIQRASIPPLLEGRDIVGQAQTGTGKTAAFVLPALARLDAANASVQVLILTPTRELAIQVADAVETYARHLRDVRVLAIYGGQAYGPQLRPLRRGVHVVAGTPGRVLDHLDRGTLDLSNVSTVVLDEADEMLKMGFIDDVGRILERTPPSRQVALFSATLPAPIRAIAQRHLSKPVEVKIEAPTLTVDSVRQRYCEVPAKAKPLALERIAEIEPFDAMLVFVRTREATAEVADRLERKGYRAAALNGDMNQAFRERTVNRLRDGGLDIVVATDVAARGLDVERITHVVNYDAPNDTEAYVHRIGRTGRAGRVGEAILFIRRNERRMLHAIERLTRQTIEPMPVPDGDALARHRVARFKARIADTMQSKNLRFFTDLLNECEAELRAKPIRIAAAIAYLAQEERPLVPTPDEREPVGDPRSQRAAPGREMPTREKAPREKVAPGMVRYRIAVGTRHGATPREVSRTIAEEAELEARFIGPIRLRDDHGFIDLPEGMPKPLFRHLKRVEIEGQALRLTRL